MSFMLPGFLFFISFFSVPFVCGHLCRAPKQYRILSGLTLTEGYFAAGSFLLIFCNENENAFALCDGKSGEWITKCATSSPPAVPFPSEKNKLTEQQVKPPLPHLLRPPLSTSIGNLSSSNSTTMCLDPRILSHNSVVVCLSLHCNLWHINTSIWIECPYKADRFEFPSGKQNHNTDMVGIYSRCKGGLENAYWEPDLPSCVPDSSNPSSRDYSTGESSSMWKLKSGLFILLGCVSFLIVVFLFLRYQTYCHSSISGTTPQGQNDPWNWDALVGRFRDRSCPVSNEDMTVASSQHSVLPTYAEVMQQPRHSMILTSSSHSISDKTVLNPSVENTQEVRINFPSTRSAIFENDEELSDDTARLILV